MDQVTMSIFFLEVFLFLFIYFPLLVTIPSLALACLHLLKSAIAHQQAPNYGSHSLKTGGSHLVAKYGSYLNLHC